MDEGKVARKSDFITETPIRNKQPSEREQVLPKKPRSAIKKDLIAFFGEGRRTPAPSTEGSPIETVKQRREHSSAGQGDVEPVIGGKTVDNNSWLTPTVKKKRDKTKSIIQDEENEKEQSAKKPRSDDEESKAGNTVDLESMSASLRKKGQPKSKKSKEDSAKKPTKSPRKKATFAPVDSEEPGRNKEEEKEVPVTAQCVIGFAIRVDRGTNTKGGFDKKVSEGLTFLREFVDPAACILPNGKDKRLGPIKTKSDLPKYQLTMRNYFNIPNQMAFTNVNQDNGRVIKGSAIMGFSLDPKTCLDEAAGDLRTMGCSMFFKKCQQVDTVSKLILLGVPNSIEEEVIKKTLDTVLTELEQDLIRTDSDYKLTNDQRKKWIDYAVTREFPPGMPWEDAEEKKKKQGGNNARLAYVLQVYQQDFDRLSHLCHMAKQRKLWANHWGNTAFTVEIPEQDSQQGEKTRYIQMVQTHGSVQLSLGAAPIYGVIDTETKFSLRLTPGADGSPRAPTQTSLREVFRMMEVNSKKVWICLAKGSNGNYTGYFSSVVEPINTHVKNFVACPGAQVYWWLRRRGCLTEDVNRMVRHCFTLDQQQKITRSKYITDKGYAVLDESNSDDIINAAAEEGIFDTTLGLSEKERRTVIAGKGHNASEIMFGEAKEGAVEAHDFSSSMSITTTHSKNENDSKSVVSQKTLAKSVFSVGTSKITSDGSGEEETDEDDGSDYVDEGDVEIEGMQMLTREQSGRKDKSEGNDHREHALEMNHATAKLNISSVNDERSMEEDKEEEEEEFTDAMEGEEDSEVDTTYVVQRGNLTDLSFDVDPDSEDEEGGKFSEDDFSELPGDHSLDQDYDTASEVSSGRFAADHANKFAAPSSFKELLWNAAGPSPGGMIIFLGLLKEDLEADEAGLPAEFINIPENILAQLAKEAGEDRGRQLETIDNLIESLESISNTISHDVATGQVEEAHEEASKTQGTLPGAHKASPIEKAADEPTTPVGRDKEGAQSPSLASDG